MRLSSLWGKVKELIDAGAIGRPLYAADRALAEAVPPGADGWRYDIQRVGNWILEEPIHFFDLARWYFQGLRSAGLGLRPGQRPAGPITRSCRIISRRTVNFSGGALRGHLPSRSAAGSIIRP